jgi:hypothetical protein
MQSWGLLQGAGMNRERYSFGYTNPELIHGKPEDNKYISTSKTFVEKQKSTLLTVLVLVFMFLSAFGLILFLTSLAPSDEQTAEYQKMQIIQEFDGCKVYRFYDGNYHYVTRCGDHTATERHYSKYCGKACTHQKVERIEND